MAPDQTKPWLMVPAFARGGILAAVRYLPYGRQDGGTGSAFFDQKPSPADAWGLLPPLIISLWAGWQGLVLIAAFVLIVLMTLAYYRRKLGCITGDMIGALIEISETGMLLAAALVVFK